MQTPMTVTFLGMAPSVWIEGDIRKRASKLETLCPDITSCHVVVDVPHRHHEEGNRFSVRIDVTVPGEELAATRESNVHAARKDLGEQDWTKQFDVDGERKHLRLVIKDAFDVARRQIQDYVRRRRLEVKTHQEPLRGRVSRWNAIDAFGTIEGTDGRELYFHQNSVLGTGLKRLQVATEVVFVEEAGEKGPQASTVRVVAQRAGAA